MGSKNRHAKEMLPIILAGRYNGQWYVEPFVGGANMIDKVDGNRIGADINEYLIAFWVALQNGWTPPEYVTREEYRQIRDSKGNYEKALVGWVAHGCSYNGKWFGGFAGKIITKIGTNRDYQAECRRDVLRQLKHLNGVELICASYCELFIPENSIIYCDPPYAGTTGYRNTFDHVNFWQWCRDRGGDGHTVYVSEYSAPDDFICVWEKTVNSSLTENTGGKQGVEKMFKFP